MTNTKTTFKSQSGKYDLIRTESHDWVKLVIKNKDKKDISIRVSWSSSRANGHIDMNAEFNEMMKVVKDNRDQYRPVIELNAVQEYFLQK